METVLELKNLSKQYDGFKLDNVDITLPKGSIMGFVGENGAGKSTAIKLIVNLIHRDGGEITVFGRDNIKYEKQIKEDIGVVLDESSFPDNMNAESVGKMMKHIYKNWDAGVFAGRLEAFALPPEKPVKDYSRGMKMKLAIAVALSHGAKLLILDEATSGLDPIVRDEILDIFMEFIQDEEHSIFLSSHIISDLEKIADYITFIHKGKILFSEQKDDLLYKYGVLKCTVEEYEAIDKTAVKGCRKNRFGVEALVVKQELPGGYTVDQAGIEDMMLFMIRGDEK